MKKIMFDDRFGLTAAVNEGWKNMTRRPSRKKYVKDANGNLSWNGEYLPPRYKVGEIVAVAQSYREIEKEIERDGLPLTLKDSILKSPGYRNKMYVRADFMPHQIRITAVRSEYLQDISDEDCLREGVQKGGHYAYYVHGKDDILGLSAKGVFSILIDKVSGKGTWKSNPWVYVYEFEKVR